MYWSVTSTVDLIVRSDVAKEYDPPVVSPPDVTLPPCEDLDLPDCDAASTVHSVTDHPSSETVTLLVENVPEETSTVGSSLVDSDDELLASRLPGYLNSF